MFAPDVSLGVGVFFRLTLKAHLNVRHRQKTSADLVTALAAHAEIIGRVFQAPQSGFDEAQQTCALSIAFRSDDLAHLGQGCSVVVDFFVVAAFGLDLKVALREDLVSLGDQFVFA